MCEKEDTKASDWPWEVSTVWKMCYEEGERMDLLDSSKISSPRQACMFAEVGKSTDLPKWITRF